MARVTSLLAADVDLEKRGLIALTPYLLSIRRAVRLVLQSLARHLSTRLPFDTQLSVREWIYKWTLDDGPLVSPLEIEATTAPTDYPRACFSRRREKAVNPNADISDVYDDTRQVYVVVFARFEETVREEIEGDLFGLHPPALSFRNRFWLRAPVYVLTDVVTSFLLWLLPVLEGTYADRSELHAVRESWLGDTPPYEFAVLPRDVQLRGVRPFVGSYIPRPVLRMWLSDLQRTPEPHDRALRLILHVVYEWLATSAGHETEQSLAYTFRQRPAFGRGGFAEALLTSAIGRKIDRAFVPLELRARASASASDLSEWTLIHGAKDVLPVWWDDGISDAVQGAIVDNADFIHRQIAIALSAATSPLPSVRE
jgi:hypothetical protein